jgi:hypothetical protein
MLEKAACSSELYKVPLNKGAIEKNHTSAQPATSRKTTMGFGKKL